VDPAGWTGHVVVSGLHGEGLRAIEQLHLAGVRVVVVDDHPDPRLGRMVAGWGLPYLERDSRLPETLLAAGLAGAVALICCEEDDLHTLATALLARELRPEIRVVVQMRNPAVGRAVAGTGAVVLDVARLSAPSLVEACLRTGSHALELAGRRFLTVTETATTRGTLRSRYGELTPIAVQPSDGADAVLCPPQDTGVQPGDQITVLGTPAQLAAAGVWGGSEPAPVPDVGLVGARYAGLTAAGRGAAEPSVGVVGASVRPRTPAQAFRAGLRRVRQVVRSVLQAADRRIWAVLGCLLILILTSTAVLRVGYAEPGGEGMSVLDALYFTVESVGTVGYGDFYFRDQPSWLRIFAIGLMVIGALLATVFFALLTNLLVTRRIEESLGRLRVTRLADHVVVIGLGSIGVRVVELLVERGVQVVVVESDDANRYLAHARALGVPVVTGDATQSDTLRAVHLGRARGVAVLTSGDLTNIETGLAVRDLLDAVGPASGEIPVVLRLFDRELARTVERSFGFDSVRSTAALAAPWFVGAALGVDVLGTFYVADTPLLVAGLPVPAGSGLDGLRVADLPFGGRVAALARAGDGPDHPPRGADRLAAGDVAYLVGPYEELLHLIRGDLVRVGAPPFPGPPA
jgi:Trk K+ transport system NAD-binding subunit